MKNGPFSKNPRTAPATRRRRVCSPDASGAGDDCCEAMWRRKRETYAEYLEELAAQGIRYEPMVFSCFGRVHHNCAVTLERLAQQAARRQGVASHRGILRRTLKSLGVALVRRAVAMAKACQHPLRAQALQLHWRRGRGWRSWRGKRQHSGGRSSLSEALSRSWRERCLPRPLRTPGPKE